MSNATKNNSTVNLVLKNLDLTANAIVKLMKDTNKVEYVGEFDDITVRMSPRDGHIIDLFIDDDKVSFVGELSIGNAIVNMCKTLPENIKTKRLGVVAFTLHQLTTL